MHSRLLDIFQRLAAHFGPLHWWPAETPFEVVIGAFLTQNTAWSNVEMAMANLRRAEALHPAALAALPRTDLEELIRPSGFFRQKAEHLHLFVARLLTRHDGDLASMLDGDLEAVRRDLLAQKGVGPETADAILLYAGGRPTFVVDGYTRRLLGRLGLIAGTESYGTIRALFMTHLPPDPDLYNEFHALIVEECKIFCRKKDPLCRDCPLLSLCPRGKCRVI